MNSGDADAIPDVELLPRPRLLPFLVSFNSVDRIVLSPSFERNNLPGVNSLRIGFQKRLNQIGSAGIFEQLLANDLIR